MKALSLSRNIVYKKHIDASVKERSQTLLVSSEEIYKRVLINIFNTIYYFKPTNLILHKDNKTMPFVNSTPFFGFVYHELKQKIK